MDINEKIIKAIEKVTGIGDINLDVPEREEFGDYSANAAMQLFASTKDKGHNAEKSQNQDIPVTIPKSLNTKLTEAKSPRQLAEEIIKKLEQDKELEHYIEKIEVAGPGFINFHLKTQVLLDNLKDILEKGEEYGKAIEKTGKKVIIEHTQPNTNKPNHIGHLRNSLLGMALVRMYSAIGNEVVSTNINNDRGIANIKGMWAYLMFGQDIDKTVLEKPQEFVPEKYSTWKEVLSEWFDNPDQWRKPEDFSVKPDVWVGKFYVIGNNIYKENDAVKLQMQEMLRAWEESDEKVLALWKRMNDWFYEGSWQTLKRIGVKLDTQEYESELYKKGKQIIMDAVEKGIPGFSILEKGAVQVNLEKYGLPDKILVRSDGTAIYMTFDIELTRKRTQDMGMDMGIWVVANDQILHFQQLFAICELLGFAAKDRYHHLAYGYVFLPEGKMSSREGRVITIDELLDTSVEKAQQIRQQAGFAKVKGEELNETDEVVGLAAVAYSVLSQNPMGDMVFNVDKSVSFEGNSGPYLQYTFARTQSVISKALSTKHQTLNKSKTQKSNYQNVSNLESLDLDIVSDLDISTSKLNEAENSLLRCLSQYPGVILMSAKMYSPNLLCNYLYDLAQKYNHFYSKHRIIESDTQDETRNTKDVSRISYFRITLTAATGQVLKNGLELLGIQAPEKM